MPNRTVKLMGRAYSQSGDMPGDGSVSITVNFNGTQVYSGTVPTNDSTVPSDRSAPAEVLCTFEIDGATAGDIPMSVAVDNGTAFFSELVMNYNGGRVSWGPPDESGYAVPTPLEDPATTFRDSINSEKTTDSKSDVKVGGQAPLEVRDEDGSLGEWEYRINHGQTLTCKYKVVAAQFPA